MRLWFRWRFEGIEKIPRRGPALIACNHLSYFDPVTHTYAALKAGRRPRYLSKEELFRVPVFGWVMRSHGQIPVRRGTGDLRPLVLAEEALARGEMVVIYPEGTVTQRPDHLPMRGKTGVARLALASGVPVIPMASWGSAAVWQKTGKGSIRPGRPIWVRVGDPIRMGASPLDPTDEAARVLTDEVMAALTALVEDLREGYPERWAGGR